jgi:hypothetical protein
MHTCTSPSLGFARCVCVGVAFQACESLYSRQMQHLVLLRLLLSELPLRLLTISCS